MDSSKKVDSSACGGLTLSCSFLSKNPSNKHLKQNFTKNVFFIHHNPSITPRAIQSISHLSHSLFRWNDKFKIFVKQFVYIIESEYFPLLVAANFYASDKNSAHELVHWLTAIWSSLFTLSIPLDSPADTTVLSNEIDLSKYLYLKHVCVIKIYLTPTSSKHGMYLIPMIHFLYILFPYRVFQNSRKKIIERSQQTGKLCRKQYLETLLSARYIADGMSSIMRKWTNHRNEQGKCQAWSGGGQHFACFSLVSRARHAQFVTTTLSEHRSIAHQKLDKTCPNIVRFNLIIDTWTEFREVMVTGHDYIPRTKYWSIHFLRYFVYNRCLSLVFKIIPPPSCSSLHFSLDFDVRKMRCYFDKNNRTFRFSLSPRISCQSVI